MQRHCVLSLCVCMCVILLKKLWINSVKILSKSTEWLKDQIVIFKFDDVYFDFNPGIFLLMDTWYSRCHKSVVFAISSTSYHRGVCCSSASSLLFSVKNNISCCCVICRLSLCVSWVELFSLQFVLANLVNCELWTDML